MARWLLRTALLAGAVLLAGPAAAQVDGLRSGFLDPPNSARPRVWWHWLDGDVSRAGVDEDLAWMKRIGLGGVQAFDGAFNTPLLVPHPIVFMTPEWKDVFRHAVATADAQGFEFTIASSPGWSESGGPWVKPEQGMKKLVWSETTVEGGRAFQGRLASPPTVSGPFQDIALEKNALGPTSGEALSLYRDTVVVAYRAPASEAPARAAMSASAPIDLAALSDGDLARSVELAYAAAGEKSWVQADYGRPQTVRALRISLGRISLGPFSIVPTGRIMASDDGRNFRLVAELPHDGAPQQTIAFPATSARIFRVEFAPPPPASNLAAIPGFAAAPPKGYRIAELSFETAARVNRFEDKAGWSAVAGLDRETTPPVAPGDAIARREVVDLTARMRPDGALDWTPPPGRWVVLRMGWSLTGVTNHPASPAGTGLEVDKLNRQHVRAYIDAYLDAYAGAVGPGLMGARGVHALVTDSYEAGPANWTDDILDQFKARRGYDPTPWLPVLTGRVIESAEASEAFLWDFRKTLGDLIAEAHYGELSDALHARGMIRYGESHENGRAFVGDGMQVKASADVPMGAMWAHQMGGEAGPTNYDADLRESASTAHLYGQNLVGAESFTSIDLASPYDFTPERLKPIADRMLADGVNRFSIHTSVHQPVDDAGPGIGLGPFGQWFTRKETWAEMAGPWISYLARSSQILQQGRNAADVLWFYGEDDNITALYGQALPPVPNGYAYDFVNADALTRLLSVKDGRITAPSGASYRVLALAPQARRMSLPVLKKIRDLVQAGAVVVGRKPEIDVSLADDASQFHAIADRLWGGDTGQGRVIADPDLAAALAQLRVPPDLEGASDDLRFAHRRLADGDVYFVANAAAAPKALSLKFRVSGKAAELWRADTGEIAPASYAAEPGGTRVPLRLAAHDAVFVVFRQPAATARRIVGEPVERTVATLHGPWRLTFPPDRDAPAQTTFASLQSWTESADPRVKYFSGVATYRQALTLDRAATRRGARLVLDLGEVKNVAEVRVNGRSVGIAWKAPFRVDITQAARAGVNTIEIRVANLWPNRLIGDRQPGATQHATAVFDPLRADSPLLPSGLLGPVRVLSVRVPALHAP